MQFYKVCVRCFSPITNDYFYHYCLMAAKTPYEAICKFQQTLDLSTPPLVLGKGEFIENISAKETDDISSVVIFCSDGSISLEVLAK